MATANATGASTGIYSYGPYGEPNTTTGPRFRYTGQQLIGDLGLYYYKARFYSPGLGRFLQTDPIGYKDDVNLYAYVGNNAANRIDPSGLIAREAVALAAGLGGAISDGWSASVAAFQNESLGDMALKSVEGLNPTVGAAAGAGVKLLGAAAKEATPLNGAIKITEQGMAHVVERHTVNDIAKFAGKSKFNEGESLPALITSGAQQQTVQQANGNFARTWDAGRSVGIDRGTGQQTSVVTVITRPNGELVTAFPGRP